MPLLNRNNLMTTGMVSKATGAAPRTVAKWIDAGLLRGHRIPGSGDRRVRRAELIRFCRAHDIPICDGPYRALVAAADPSLRARLAAAVAAEGLEVAQAASLWDAGALYSAGQFPVVVLDFALGRAEAAAIARGIDAAKSLVVGIACEDHAGIDPHFDEVYRLPFDAALLAERVRRALEDGEL